MKTNTPSNSKIMLFAGIDFHKRYSVVHVVDSSGAAVKKGRIEPNSVAGFAAFFAGFAPGSVRAVFESSMNWGYLYDLLNEVEAVADVTLANPYKTKIIAEASVKTDKIDARWLATLARDAGSRRCIAADSSPSPTPPRSSRAASRNCCGSAASSFASALPFAIAFMCCSALNGSWRCRK